MTGRETDPSDRCGSIIRLGDDGLRLLGVLAPEHLADEERLLSALSADERTTLAGLLRHLLVSLENTGPFPGDPLRSGSRIRDDHATPPPGRWAL